MSARSVPSSRCRWPTTRCQNTSKSRPSCHARIPARFSSGACAIPIGYGRGGGFKSRSSRRTPGPRRRGFSLKDGIRDLLQKPRPVAMGPGLRRDDDGGPPPSLSCAGPEKLRLKELPGNFWSSFMSPQIVPSDTDARPNRGEDIAALEADARLREDIRLLGRILGDTVRDQEGADVFDLVERIRQTSIRFHRDEDRPARRELEIILDSMSISETVRIVRAFSYFSHLANIAEDQNNIRQMRARSTAAPRPGTLALTLSHARAAGFSAADLRGFFKEALVSPVLTAHPTEVRRKSTIDREMEIAALLDRRERVQLTPQEIEADDEQLRREVLTLWKTNLLRRTKLTLLDEVANGLSFYDYTFLHEVPRLHCMLEDRLNEGDGDARGELASFLRMGSWIGGDRAGNPLAPPRGV